MLEAESGRTEATSDGEADAPAPIEPAEADIEIEIPDPAVSDTTVPLPLPLPDLALLAQLALPPAVAASGVVAGGEAEAALDPAPPSATSRMARRPALPARSAADAASRADGTAMQARAVVPPAETLPAWSTAAASLGLDPKGRPLLQDTGLAPNTPLAVLGAGRPHESAPASNTAAASTATIAAPVESPDFAAELGVRLSVLARDGVQRAELRLNPLELGPVAVQIAIDGAQARIDFGADAAVTRAAIEASLPALAAALRDAGLTLAGGGVSQHAHGQGDPRASGQDDFGAPHRGSATREGGSVISAAVVTRQVRAGGIDLYA